MTDEIRTARLSLRPLSSADVTDVYRILSDKSRTAYLLRPLPETREETAAFLSRAADEWQRPVPRFFEFAVARQGEVIGLLSVTLDGKREAGELCWMLARAHEHCGYAAEAAQALIDFSRDTLHLQKLTAHCDDRNAASYRLMERLGMRLESGDGVRVYPRTMETACERTYVLFL